MQPIPLDKNIYNKAKELNIEQIKLSFSGGHDEGYLDVNTLIQKDFPTTKEHFNFENEIEKWALVAYEYDGGGCGQDYGDNFVYNLIKNTVTFNHWRTEIVAEDNQEAKLEIGSN